MAIPFKVTHEHEDRVIELSNGVTIIQYSDDTMYDVTNKEVVRHMSIDYGVDGEGITGYEIEYANGRIDQMNDWSNIEPFNVFADRMKSQSHAIDSMQYAMLGFQNMVNPPRHGEMKALKQQRIFEEIARQTSMSVHEVISRFESRISNNDTYSIEDYILDTLGDDNVLYLGDYYE